MLTGVCKIVYVKKWLIFMTLITFSFETTVNVLMSFVYHRDLNNPAFHRIIKVDYSIFPNTQACCLLLDNHVYC